MNGETNDFEINCLHIIFYQTTNKQQFIIEKIQSSLY